MTDWLDAELMGAMPPKFPSLERVMTGADYVGLSTATPLQRAFWRALDGIPLGELADLPLVQRAFGGNTRDLPTRPPDQAVMLAGIRTAKSLVAAMLGMRASQICDVSKLGPGEIPRVSIVSLKRDLAKPVYDHLIGHLSERPMLRPLVAKKPTTDTVYLRHPTGRTIEVKIVAGARAGASLVARWSAGVIFDEAPRMIGQEAGVVNLDDMRAAVVGRLLPGAQIVYLGSPWAPFGPLYRLVSEFEGKPSESMVVMRGRGPDLNPVKWTPEACAKLKLLDPTAYQTDVEAEFADQELSWLESVLLDECSRKTPGDVPRETGLAYVAAMDPATRGNAWTLVVATRKAGKFVVVAARQWIGSKVAPLSPKAVLHEVAAVLRSYGIKDAATDQYAGDALRDLAIGEGINLWITASDEKRKANRFKSFHARLSERMVELPADHVLRDDMLAVRKRITQTGVSYDLPRTADGRHCDYVPAVTLALSFYLDEPPGDAPRLTAAQRAEADLLAAEDEDDRELARQAKAEFWEQDL